MDQRIEAVARAICVGEDLDPDATVTSTDYAGELRSGHREDVPQWRTKAREAARFIAMFEALTPSGLQPAPSPGGAVPPGTTG